MTAPSDLPAPKRACGCPDPNDAQHCLLLQDFPGGFYGDMEAGRDEECDCECHLAPDDYDEDGRP